MKSNSYLFILIAIFSFISITYCLSNNEQSEYSNLNLAIINKYPEDKSEFPNQSSQTNNNPLNRANDFLEKLANKQPLKPFMSNNWSLIYHTDNRCDGSTDGHLDSLSSSKVDETIKIQVENNGDGWACDKKEPSRFEIEFSLRKEVEHWDRFEIAEYSDQEEKVFYILGGGESDYIKIYFKKSGDKCLIIKLEYRSEDPG